MTLDDKYEFLTPVEVARLLRITRRGPEHVPDTTIPRLRPVAFGRRARGFLDDQIDTLIDGLRRFRDGSAQ